MRSGSIFVFLVLIAAICGMNGAKSSNTANNQIPLPQNTCDKAVVYNCNVNQADSHASQAITQLEKMMENLTAIFSKTSTSQPKPSAVPASSCMEQYKKHKEAIKTLETKLENLIALINKTYTPQPAAVPASSCKKQYKEHKKAIKTLETKLENLIIALANKLIPASSCKELYEKDNSSTSQVYTMKFGSQKIPVYCHMGNFGCGDGGWTMAMKIDGTKNTFHYDSHFWSDRNVYNIAGGQTDFDTQETKLPTYWNTPFSKICLGMKLGQQMKFIVINRHANSLHSLIADGQYRATKLGRNTWKTLIGSQASLQTKCNKEGFNAKCIGKHHSRARIGITNNEGNDCNLCDSRIGFGTGGLHDNSNTCGNEATYSPDNGNKHIKAMGYILVQ